MCGIAGFFSPLQHFSDADLHHMTDALSHRGPDADGFFSDETCGLGHRRLSIIDLSEAANQPMFSHNTRFVCIYNGEIYNFKDLKKQLAAQGIFCKTTSDTEVLLEWFVLKGNDFVHELNGIFAIAIYDTHLRKLTLFRDRLGIKPLYYFWNGTDFAFASEIKSLLTLPQVPRLLDFIEITRFLHLGYCSTSVYQFISKLAPGGYLKVEKNRNLYSDNYWKPQAQVSEKILTDEPEALTALDRMLHHATEMQMIADVPLGVFLSGGIDSSTVAAIAAQHASGSRLKTFSIGFEAETFNEAPFASAVARHLGTDHHELTVTTQQAQELIPQLLGVFDEPFADSSAIPMLLVSELARKQVTVALSGDGGDELFLGYGTYDWAKRLKNPFLKGIKNYIQLGLGLSKKDSFRKGRRMFDYPNLNWDLGSHIFSQEQGFFSAKEVQELLMPDIQGLLNPPYVFLQQNENAKRKLNPMEQQALFDLQLYLPDDLLVKVDRTSMRYGLEVRVPLLDHRLVEWALNLSPELKKKNGIRKYLLKKVLYQYVPEKLFDRPKRGFAVPLAQWLQTDLRFLVEDFLNEEVVRKAGVVNWEKVKMLKEQFLKGDTFIYNKIWLLIVLHQFLIKK